MNRIKRILGAASASTILALSVTGIAAADTSASNTCDASKGGSTACSSEATDNSTTYSVNGNCSGIVQTKIEQSNNNETEQNQGAVNGNVNVLTNKNDDTATTDQAQSNTTNQGNNGTVTFSPNCSTTNVTQQAAATTTHRIVRTAAQVQAPRGGVGAGEGGSVSSVAGPLAAFVGSVGSLGAGVLRLRKSAISLDA